MDVRTGATTNQRKIGLPYEAVFPMPQEMTAKEPLSLAERSKVEEISNQVPPSQVTSKQASIMSGKITDFKEPDDMFERELAIAQSDTAVPTALTRTVPVITPELAERAKEYGVFPIADEQGSPEPEPLINLSPEEDAFSKEQGMLGAVKDVIGKRTKSKKSKRKGMRPGDIKSIMIFAGAISASAVAVWALANAPAIISRATFFREEDERVAYADPAKQESNLTAAEFVGGSDRMTVNGIGVTDANVIYSTATDEKGIVSELGRGIVHYGNTALPGETGNAVYFGHSSNVVWSPGSYNGIFTNLDRVKNGDHIVIVYAGKRYVYEVAEERVVSPKDLSVLAQSPTPQVTLITCTPVGTALRRHVVTAKQISPIPTSGTAPADRLPQV